MDGSNEVDCPPPEDGDAPAGDAPATTTTQPVVDKKALLYQRKLKTNLLCPVGEFVDVPLRRTITLCTSLIPRLKSPIETLMRAWPSQGISLPPAKLYNGKSFCTLQTVEGKSIYFYKWRWTKDLRNSKTKVTPVRKEFQMLYSQFKSSDPLLLLVPLKQDPNSTIFNYLDQPANFLVNNARHLSVYVSYSTERESKLWGLVS